MKIFDQHVHSYYSYDSNQSIKEYLDKAKELGLSYFILTDHCDFSFQDKEDNAFDVIKRKEELEELQKDYSEIKILNGIEIGYKKKDQKRIEELIKSSNFDLVNLSIHDLNDVDFYIIDFFKERGIKKVLTDYFDALLDMVKNFDDFDVLCHIDFGFKSGYLCDNSISIKEYEDYLIKIMNIIIKKDKALEINTKVQEYLPIEHTRYLLDLYKRLGGKNITIASDAHKVERFYSGIDKYIKLIKEAGFDHLNYFIKRNRYNLSI